MPEAPVAPAAPQTPSVPVIVPVSIITYEASTPEAGYTQGPFFYWPSNPGNGGLVSQIILENGSVWNISNFTNNATSSPYTIEFAQYNARTPQNASGVQVATESSSTGTTSISASYGSSVGVGSAYLGVVRASVGIPYTGFEKGSTVNIDATNRTSAVKVGNVIQMRQFIHFDPDATTLDLAGIKDLTAGELTKLTSYRDTAKYNNGIANIGLATVVMLKGKINVDGAGIAVLAMMTHHPTRNDPFAVNTGEILVEGEKHAVFIKTRSTEQTGGSNSQYLTFANGNIDGNQGKITINANESVVFA